jgi:hypothetical protein
MGTMARVIARGKLMNRKTLLDRGWGKGNSEHVTGPMIVATSVYEQTIAGEPAARSHLRKGEQLAMRVQRENVTTVAGPAVLTP